MNKKLKRITLGLAASLFLVACQDTDIPQASGDDRSENTVTAYLNVNLTAVGESDTRAASDGGYKDGTTDTPDEFTIKKVDFYFFDGNGKPFAVTPLNTNCFTYGEDYKNQGEEPAGDNTESIWPDNGPVLTLVLHLKDNDQRPELMVAVVNSETTYANQSLDDLEQILIEGTVNADKTFIMTSSSFYDAEETENSQAHPYAVKIADRFKDSFQEGMDTPVDIYVERLAVKVRLSVKLKEGAKAKIVTGNDLPEEIRNEEGTIIKVEGIPYSGNADDTRTAYIKLRQWGLNATEKQAYLMKELPAVTGENTNLWWNVSRDHRSCWGISPHSAWNADNYGDYYANSGSTGNALTEEGKVVTDNDNGNIILDVNADLKDKALEYHSQEEYLGASGTAVNNVLYTREHMPDAEHYTNMNKYSCVTSAVLIAQILGFEDNKNGFQQLGENENLYRMSDKFWDHGALVNVLYDMYEDPDAPDGYKKGPNIWKLIEGKEYNETDVSRFKKIDASYFQLVDLGDGLVGLGTTEKLDKSLAGKGETLYVYYKWGNDVPKFYSYTQYGDENSPGNESVTIRENVYVELRNYNEKVYIPLSINGFKGGMMYYDIPIEHHQSGMYGVVRNHCYDINVDDITNLGWGIFDPAEKIVPIPRGGYGLSFRVQVCPWHLKEHEITLNGEDGI